VQDYVYKNEATGSLLARTMMYAIERQEAHDALERRVEERTAALTKTNERITNILKSISDGFIAMDENLVVTYFNETAEQLLGREREDVEGRNLFEAFPEAKGSIFEEKYTQAARERISLDFETYFGVEPYENWYGVRVQPYENGITAYFQVVTERKREEKERKRYIRELQVITDTTTAASRMEDVDEMCELIGGAIHDVNEEAYVIVSLYDRELDAIRVRAMVGDGETFERVFGQFGDDLADVLAVPLSDLDEQTRPYATGNLERIRGGLHALLGGKVPQETCRKVEDEANIGAVYAVGFALEDKPYGGISILLPQGQELQYPTAIETLASHFSVVMQRRQAEEALRQSEEQYRVLFESFPLGITVADSSGQILGANAESERLLGISRDEHAARQIDGEEWQIIRPDGSPMPAEEYASVRALQENRLVEDIEAGIIRPDGEITWISVTAAPLGDDRVVITYNDITERILAEQQVDEQKRHMQLAQEMARIGYWSFDIETGVPTWSDMMFEILGCDPANGVSNYDTHRQFIHPDDWTLFDTAVQGAKHGTPYNIEMRVVFPDGSIHYVNAQGYPETTAEGRITQLFGTTQDITERKRTEEALRATRERYRSLFEETPVGLYRTTVSGEILEANPALVSMLGYQEREALLEADVLDFYLDPDDRKRNVGTSSTADDWESVEVRLRRKDGQIIWVRDTGRAVRDSEGQICYYDGALVDITERRRAEETLRQRNRELALLRRAGQAFDSSLDLKQVLATVLEETRRLLDVVACSVWLVDPDTDELVCWQATGPRREVVRDWRLAPGVGVAGQVVRHGESFIVSDTRTDERYFAGVAQEAGLDLRSVLAVPLRVKEGVIGVLEMVDVEVDGFTLDDMLLGEQLAASAAIAIENARLYEQAQQEIAERKRAEEEIEHYAAELERSNRDLQQFAYAVSHDLQEPLRVSTSYLRLLEERYDDQLDDRADKYIGKAVSSAERMKAMINALLDLSRVGTRGEEPAPADAEEVLKRILGSLERAIEDANAKVTHDPLPTVMADEAQLAQIFQNLIANAIKFRHEGKRPHVHISAGREGDEWLFSVADNGIGIDPEQVDRIFQIFQRLHTEEEYPGLGMGLALCKRIVERHGGRIWVASEVGHGSTFTFTLPARPKA
jgi:hypothetical protein